MRSSQIPCSTSLRKTGPRVPVNELICKVLRHNICVLIQSMHELGVPAIFEAQPNFRAKPGFAQIVAAAQKVVILHKKSACGVLTIWLPYKRCDHTLLSGVPDAVAT
jgi:hypothetical protein